MNGEGLGCIGAIALLAVGTWVPFHFSGKAILYNRETNKVELTYGTSYFVKCHYFNSTGVEETAKQTGYPDSYFCPRYKDVGAL